MRSSSHGVVVVTYGLCLQPPADWTGSTGYVQKELLKSFLPAPSKDSLIMVCGPPPMMNHISGTVTISLRWCLH